MTRRLAKRTPTVSSKDKSAASSASASLTPISILGVMEVPRGHDLAWMILIA